MILIREIINLGLAILGSAIRQEVKAITSEAIVLGVKDALAEHGIEVEFKDATGNDRVMATGTPPTSPTPPALSLPGQNATQPAERPTTEKRKRGRPRRFTHYETDQP